MSDLVPKKPTHKLKAKLRDGSATNDVGVAWMRQDGSFSVQLNVGVSLRWDDPLILSLFPIGRTALDVARELNEPKTES